MSEEDEFMEEEDEEEDEEEEDEDEGSDGSDGCDEESVNDDSKHFGTSMVRNYLKIRPCAVDTTKNEYACKFCGYKQVSLKMNPTAMARHLILCEECPHSAKLLITKKTNSREVRAAAIIAGLLPSDASASPVTTPRQPTRRPSNVGALSSSGQERFRGGAASQKKVKPDKSEPCSNKGSSTKAQSKRPPKKRRPKTSTYTKVSILPNGKCEQRCLFCGFTKEFYIFRATAAKLHTLQCSRAPHDLKMDIAETSRSSEVTDLAKALGLLVDDTSTPQIFEKSAGQRAKSLGDRNEDNGDIFAAMGSTEPSNKRKRTSAGASSANVIDHVTININLMKLIAGCGLPLEIVDSPHFFTFVQSLNREYADQSCLPKADALVTDWMPKLYQIISNDVQMMWKAEGNAKRTMGVDTFSDDMGNKVFLFSEGLLDKICFSFVQVTSKDEADADYVADLLIKRLEATAEAAGKPVEDMFCAVTFDNLVENLEATKKVQEKFPKISMNGCRTRCIILLNADIYHIPEISQLVENVESVLNFIVSNPSVNRAYKRAAEKVGAKKIKASYIKIEPGTKIGVASDIKIEVLLGPEDKNVEVLTQLVMADPQRWATIVEGLPDQEVEAFTNLILDETFLEKVKAFRRFSKPLRLLTEHFELTEVRSSWICGAFEAFWTDVDSWCNDTSIQHLFEMDTFSQVKKIVDKRWIGEGNVQEGLYSEDYFLAAILDPATLPEVGALPQNWHPQCEEILSRFYDEMELDLARRELMQVVLRQGYWGDQVQKLQDSLRSSVPDNLTSATEKVVFIQSSNAHERPHLLWQAVYNSHFPHLAEIATRLLNMSTQCGQVERACSRNTIYSKLKNKMENPTVQQLLYCHINLRLACNEDVKEYEGFLDQAILDIAMKEEKKSKRIAENEDHSKEVGGDSKEKNTDNEQQIIIKTKKSREKMAKDDGAKDDGKEEKTKEPKNDWSHWPLKRIVEPHDNDVLFGRGGGTNNHPGNKRYRKMVEDRQFEYVNCETKIEKQHIAFEIIREWREQEPPGRFLKMDEMTGLWNDVGGKMAKEKTSQTLRQYAPQIRKVLESELM